MTLITGRFVCVDCDEFLEMKSMEIEDEFKVSLPIRNDGAYVVICSKCAEDDSYDK